MCGICGFSNISPAPKISEWIRTIEHRGPDNLGSSNLGPSVFGFARLAINDISFGSQPFVDELTNLMTVVNGEIYNHMELRTELINLGYIFNSRSDTEVVHVGYRAWGSNVFAKLEGMFAIAIWDGTLDEIFLARDRLGKKPLYWANPDKGIIFSSELKTLIPFIKNKVINPAALSQYLISDSVPSPETIIAGVKKLEPGSYLQWSAAYILKIQSFWEPEIPIPSNSSNPIANFRSALEDSVRDRLMSDVPIGILLSSGIDSTIIGSLASRMNNKSMDSFTLKFQGSFDESKNAKEIANKLNFNHTEVDINSTILISEFERMTKLMDEPLNDPAFLPMLTLSAAAREKVKVVLTGDGGDELFMGYPQAILNLKLDGWKTQVLKNIPLFQMVLRQIPDPGTYFSIGFKAQRFERGLGAADFFERDLLWRGSFSPSHTFKILKKDFLDELNPSSVMETLASNFEHSPFNSNVIDKWSWWYLRSYLMDTVLVKVDRATMAFGLEARSPLLDRKVVEAVFAIRSEKRITKSEPKKILREYLQILEPAIEIPKKKHGMGVPVIEILKGPLRGRLYEALSPARIRSQGIFEPTEVASLLKAFEGGKKEVRKELWSMFVFQNWHEEWMEK
jgi:asparagine synthase (glutamine-hydrolysing)